MADENEDKRTPSQIVWHDFRLSLIWLVVSLLLTFCPWLAFPQWAIIVSWVIFALTFGFFAILMTVALVVSAKERKENNGHDE